MFSLQVILGQDKKFFELLIASALDGQTSVQAIRQMIESPDKEVSLSRFIETRRHDKGITNTINEMVCKTFVTVLEREDLEALATALYKIPKTAEKFAERYWVGRDRIRGVDLSAQLPLLERATEIVVSMVKELHHQRLDEILKLSRELRGIEEQADKAITDLTSKLYLANGDLVQAIILKDLYELLEKVVDRCRTAGNIMARVALTHS